jgi:hypothetical protein
MYPYLECSELIKEISKASEGRRESKLQDEFLILFAKNSPLSAYQIYKIYNEQRSYHKMTYISGVKKRIKRLLGRNLIEKVENNTSKHRAIYYRLSTAGLYHLIYNKRGEFIGLFNKTLQHYDQHIIFRILLYPYCQKSSLEDISDTGLISKICIYLYDCCEEARNTLESIKKSYSRYVVQQICLWNDVHERGGDNYRLIDFLKRKFNLNWLDNRAEVTKYGNDNTIRISKDNNWVLIKLNERRTKAIMTMDGNVLYEFTFSPRLEILYRGKQTIEEWSMFFFLKRIESLAADLVIALASKAIMESDIKVLSQDEKFMLVLEKNKKKLDERCRKLEEFTTPGS